MGSIISIMINDSIPHKKKWFVIKRIIYKNFILYIIIIHLRFEQYNFYTQLFQRLHNTFKVVKYNFLNCVILLSMMYYTEYTFINSSLNLNRYRLNKITFHYYIL